MRMRIGVNIERRTGRCSKTAASVTEKYRQVGRLMIRDHQVGIPVVVHICDRNIVRKMTRGHR